MNINRERGYFRYNILLPAPPPPPPDGLTPEYLHFPSEFRVCTDVRAYGHAITKFLG